MASRKNGDCILMVVIKKKALIVCLYGIGKVGPSVLMIMLVILADSQQHGFINRPASRAYLCARHINHHCGPIIYEPQSIEALKGFPARGPPDNHIAGGGVFFGLDAPGRNRWKRIRLNNYLRPLNQTHLRLQVRWVYTAPHKTAGYHLFGTVKGFNGEEPLQRRKLRFIDYRPSPRNKAYTQYNYTVAKKRLHAVGTLLAIWDVADTANGFYQVIDYFYNKKGK